MERKYLPKPSRIGVTETLDLKKHFNEYGSLVFPVEMGKPDIKDLAKYFCTTKADVTKLEEICSFEKLLPQISNDIQLPYEGYKPNFASQDIPDCALTLKSLQTLQGRTKTEQKNINNAVLKYRGEVDLEDTGKVTSDGDDLDPLLYYVVKVRVYVPGVHVKSSSASRSTFPQVSQEFLCLSSGNLMHLRDRIICSADYQPTTGDVSDNPFVKTTVRTKDVDKSSMFYLGNNFYVDTRNPDNTDYSAKILEWGAEKCYELGNAYIMEETSWQNVRDLRLGYPYLYVHQNFCEHLIVLTDSRLLHDSDCMDSTKYPIMLSFANLQGKYCEACRKKPSKYVVLDNDRLPRRVTHFCTICLTLFNYVDRIKAGNFKVYKYVDRACLI